MTAEHRRSARKPRRAKRPAIYSDDFRKGAIAAGKDSDNVAQTARDLGVSCSTLYRWLSQARRGKRKKRVGRQAAGTAPTPAGTGGSQLVAPQPQLPSGLAARAASPAAAGGAMAALHPVSLFADASTTLGVKYRQTGDVAVTPGYATFPAVSGALLQLDNPTRISGADGQRQPPPSAPLWADALHLSCPSRQAGKVLVSVLEATAQLTLHLKKNERLFFRWAFHLADPRTSAGRKHFALLQARYTVPGQATKTAVVRLATSTTVNAQGNPDWTEQFWRLPVADTQGLSVATQVPVTFTWACCSGGEIARTFYEAAKTTWDFPSAPRWLAFPSALLLHTYEVR